MEIKVPRGLIEDHKTIQAELQKMVNEGGKIGEAAQSLMDVMMRHEEREEKFALPPLGLLPALTLASGQIDYEMDEAVAMADTLRAEMPHMLAEHKQILVELKKLADAAQQEGKTQYTETMDLIGLHVEEEEQVYYPAALLVGAFLKIKLAMVDNWKFP